MRNLEGEDEPFWILLIKYSIAKISAKSPIVVYQGTVLAAKTKSCFVSLPVHMNNKNSDFKPVSSLKKTCLSEKNSLGMNVHF